MPLDAVSSFLLGCLGVLLFGAAVLVARRLVCGPRNHSRDDSLDLTLGVVGWVLIVGGFAALSFVLLPIIGLMLLIAAAAVLAEASVKHRLSQQYTLLWLMTAATERLIPLVPAIEAFAREGGGRSAARAQYLAQMLRAGVPLPEALEGVRGLLPRGALPVIRVGYESGALAAALRQAASVRDLQRPLWLAVAGRLMYLTVMAVFGASIVLFVMWKIVPSFEKIFADFESELPRMTQLLISVSHAVVLWWLLLVPVLTALGVFLIYALLCYLGLVYWDVPGTAWLARRLDAAVVMESLALAAEHRRRLPEALATLAQCHPRAAIRRRLRGVLAELERGGDWCESLAQHGVIMRADRAILQAAQRADNLPWALREMAQSNRRRLAYRLYALLQLLFPPVILTIALVELFFVVALFLPLIKLIQVLV